MRTRTRMRRRDSAVGNMINMGVGTLVGTGLIGASAGAVGALPAGMGKDMAGMAVGMQGVALLGHNVGYAKKALGISSKSKKGSIL